MSKQKRFTIVDKIFVVIYTGCLIITLITAFLHGLDSQTVYWVTPILMGMPVLWLLIRGRKGRLYDDSVYFPFSSDDLDSELQGLVEDPIFPRSKTPWDLYDVRDEMEAEWNRFEDELDQKYRTNYKKDEE